MSVLEVLWYAHRLQQGRVRVIKTLVWTVRDLLLMTHEHRFVHLLLWIVKDLVARDLRIIAPYLLLLLWAHEALHLHVRSAMQIEFRVRGKETTPLCEACLCLRGTVPHGRLNGPTPGASARSLLPSLAALFLGIRWTFNKV